MTRHYFCTANQQIQIADMTKIVALGDSITKGVALSTENGYSVLEDNFINIVAREGNLEIENFGKFGCTVTFGHILADRHAEAIAAANYTLLEFGGNDCDFNWKRIALNPLDNHRPKTTLEEFTASFESLIGKVRALGSTPIILSLPPIDSQPYFNHFSRAMSTEQKQSIIDWMDGDVEAIRRWHEDYNLALWKLATRTKTEIVNISSAFECANHLTPDLLCLDGIHPNQAGHREIAKSILGSQAFAKISVTPAIRTNDNKTSVPTRLNNNSQLSSQRCQNATL